MTTVNYNLHSSIGYQLTLTARQQERRFEAGLKALGLSRVQWCVLLAAGNEGLHAPSAIARFIGIDRTATSRALGQMQAAGLITRDAGEADRRTTRVQLTDRGRDRLARANPLAEASRKATESRLCPDELVELTRLLAKLRGGDEPPLGRL